jgi:hypothetical protein
MKNLYFLISIGLIILISIVLWMEMRESFYSADATAAIYNAAATSIALLGGKANYTIPQGTPSSVTPVAKKTTLTSNFAMIMNGFYPGRCMEKKSNGQVMSPCNANIGGQRWAYTSDKNLKLLKPPATPYYKPVDECLDVERTNQRSMIAAQPCKSGSTTQQFDLDDVGRLHLRNNKEMCLDVVKLKDNYDVVYMPCSNDASQKWSNMCLPYRECVKRQPSVRGVPGPCMEYKPLPAPC